MPHFERTPNQVRFAKFLAVGAVCLIWQTALFHTIITVGGLQGQWAEMAANFVAFTISALTNLYLHSRITWAHINHRPIRQLFMSFAQATAIAVIINQCAFVLLNRWTPSLFATAAGVVVATVFKWLLFDRGVFLGQPQFRLLHSTKVAVVMPAYNEEQSIASVVRQAQLYLSEHVDDYRIVVVNDASTDQTGQILEAMAEQSDRLIVSHNSDNLRYGKTVSKGLEIALQTPMDWVFFTDSDGQFDISEISRLLDSVRETCADMVIGYRKNRADPLIRRLNGLGWTLFCCLIFQFWVKDVDCAFKLIHRRVLEAIGPLHGSGATINPELLYKANRQKFHRTQVPVSHFPRKKGLATGANPAVVIDSFRSAIRLRFSAAA